MSLSELTSTLFSSTYAMKAAAVPAGDMLLSLALALALGLFIGLVYRRSFTGIMYSRSFAVSLIGLCMITDMIILAVNSNVILSLGMVGALSIVRFRAAVKDPMDIVFLFWAIIGGIVLGAGLIPLALVGSVVIGLVLFLSLTRKSADTPYMLILRLNGDAAEERAVKLVGESTARSLVRSKTVSAQGIELTCEVRLKNGSTDFVNRLNALDGVSSAMLVGVTGTAA